MANKTQMVLEFQRGLRSLSQVIEILMVDVYRYAQVHQGSNHDCAGDFVLYFKSRLENMVKNFRFTGVPFDHLLSRTMRYQFKSYCTKERERRRMEEHSYSIFYRDQDVFGFNPGLEVAQSHSPQYQGEVRHWPDELKPAFAPLNTWEEGCEQDWKLNAPKALAARRNIIWNPLEPKLRRALVVVCKHGLHFSEMRFLSYTRQMNVPDLVASGLYSVVHRLGHKILKRVELERVRGHRRIQKILALADEKEKLGSSQYTCDVQKRLDSQFQRLLDSTKKRNERFKLSNQKLCNRMVGLALGVPKGTVDSSIFYFLKQGQRAFAKS